ncbi:MAG: hypothetical protein EBT33_18230 [Betaproteobacteria bacterium]|nr:hypothetical protein [Betaproteobacteria bacterium]
MRRLDGVVSERGDLFAQAADHGLQPLFVIRKIVVAQRFNQRAARCEPIRGERKHFENGDLLQAQGLGQTVGAPQGGRVAFDDPGALRSRGRARDHRVQ